MGVYDMWRVSEEKVLRETLPDVLAGKLLVKDAIARVIGRLPGRSFDGIRTRFGLLVKEAKEVASVQG